MPCIPGVRRSIRLKGYDYTEAGAYFVTVCAYGKASPFGEISYEEMQLNEFGQRVETEWLKTANIRTNVELDEYVVMPNHFHGSLIVRGGHRTGHGTPCPYSSRIRPGNPIVVGLYNWSLQISHDKID